VQRWADTAGTIIANLPAIAQTIMNMVSSISMAFQKLFVLLGKLFEGLAALGLADSVEDEASRAFSALNKINEQVSMTQAKLEGGISIFEDPALVKEEQYLKKMGMLERAAELRKQIEQDASDGLATRKEEVAQLKQSLVHQMKIQEIEQRKFDQVQNLKKLLSGTAEFSFSELFTGKPGQKPPEQTVADTKTELEGVREALSDTETEMQKLLKSWNIGEEKVKSIKERFQEMLEEYKNAGGVMMDIWKSAADTVKSVFFDAMEGQFKRMEDYIRDFASAINQIISQQAALKLMTMLAPGAASPTTTATAGNTTAETGIGQGGVGPGGIGFAFGGVVNGPTGVDRVAARLTKGEMVLKARDQQNLYRMIQEGGGSKGSSTNVINNISALEPQSFYEFLSRNQDSLVGVMGNLRRDGARGFRG